MNEFAHALLGAEMRGISPAIAAEWIQHNRHNRPIQEGNVRYLVRQMEDDNYVAGVAGVGFTKSGRLVNGQHTLRAIIRSGISQICCVSYGLSEDAYEVFDTGKKRSVADALQIDNSIAAICNMLHYFVRQQTVRPAPSEIKNIFDKISLPLGIITAISDWQKRLSPTAIPAAFCASWIIDQDNMEYGAGNLRWLSHDTEMTGTPPRITQAWHAYAKAATSNGGSNQRIKTFLKALKLFDPAYRDVTRLHEIEGARLQAVKDAVGIYLMGERHND